MGRTESVVNEDVAQVGHFAGQDFVVLFLALVEAAVLEQHHLAGCDAHAIDPLGLEWHGATKQLRQTLRHRRQRVFGLELALGGAAQVRSHHHGSAGLQRHLDAGNGGADARVFSNATGIVLRHIEVSTNEHALTGHLSLGHEVLKTENFHRERNPKGSAKAGQSGHADHPPDTAAMTLYLTRSANGFLRPRRPQPRNQRPTRKTTVPATMVPNSSRRRKK